MKIIHKYPIDNVQFQNIPIERGFKILCIQNHNDAACIWAEVDTEEPITYLRIEIVGTGRELTELMEGFSRKYIGTVQINSYVWHIYQIFNP